MKGRLNKYRKNRILENTHSQKLLKENAGITKTDQPIMTGIFVRDALPFEFYRVDFFSRERFLHTKLFVVVVVVFVIVVFDRTSVREGLASREVAKNVE